MYYLFLYIKRKSEEILKGKTSMLPFKLIDKKYNRILKGAFLCLGSIVA